MGNILRCKSGSKSEIPLPSGVSYVYVGTFKGKRVAIKKLERVYRSYEADNLEIGTLKKLDHQNVVKMFTIEEDQDFR